VKLVVDSNYTRRESERCSYSQRSPAGYSYKPQLITLPYKPTKSQAIQMLLQVLSQQTNVTSRSQIVFSNSFFIVMICIVTKHVPVEQHAKLERLPTGVRIEGKQSFIQ